MTRNKRRTIHRSASLAGVGLHTGCPATMTFRPAEPGEGIVFRRIDRPDASPIRAHVSAVCAVDHRTVLGGGGITIDTVEHVLAAVWGWEIDDLRIDVDGPEIPILDGSAEIFYRVLGEAGPADREGTVAGLRAPRPILAREGDAEYRAEPGPRKIVVSVERDHPLIGRQRGDFTLSPDVFGREIAAARTFGFAEEVGALRQRGLIQGGHPGCAVVLSDTGVIDGGLRWSDEFVRHKALDLIGDLALLGAPFLGTVEARRPSHRGNIALARAILDHCSRAK
jgi:UDP-3-O-acyl N-acetylglucosamine deacetylase